MTQLVPWKKSRNGYLFLIDLGGQMSKSTFNILRYVDKMAIYVYNLIVSQLQSLQAKMQLAVKQKSKVTIHRTVFLLFIVVRLIKGYATLCLQFFCLFLFTSMIIQAKTALLAYWAPWLKEQVISTWISSDITQTPCTVNLQEYQVNHMHLLGRQ